MPQAPATRQGWSRRRRVTLLGLILGGLQVLLLLGFRLQVLLLLGFLFERIAPDPVAWGWLLFGALLYVLFPALAGFLAAEQARDPGVPLDEGCLVGGIGVLPPIITYVVLSVLDPPRAPVARLLLVGSAVLFVIFFEVVGGVFGGFLGGWIGGLLGKRRLLPPKERGESRADGAPERDGPPG